MFYKLLTKQNLINYNIYLSDHSGDLVNSIVALAIEFYFNIVCCFPLAYSQPPS